MRKQSPTDRLIEISRLRDESAGVAVSGLDELEAAAYLATLEALESLKAPPPDIDRVMRGRNALLQAVEMSRQQPAAGGWWQRRLRLAGIPASFAAVALLVSGSAAAVAVDLPGSRSMMTEVKAAFRLSENTTPESPRGPMSDPGWEISSHPFSPLVIETGVPPVAEDSVPVDVSPSAPRSGSGSAQGVDPPGQGSGSQGQGQGVEPSGLGGENPSGQGVEPPGLGGENPGQGVEPPGLGGENPGQGNGPQGTGSPDPGPQETSPGRSGDTPAAEKGLGNQGPGTEPPGPNQPGGIQAQSGNANGGNGNAAAQGGNGNGNN